MDILFYLLLFLLCSVAFFIFLHKLNNSNNDDFLALFEIPSYFLISVTSLIIGLLALDKTLDILFFNYPIVIFFIIAILCFIMLRKKPKKKKNKKISSSGKARRF